MNFHLLFDRPLAPRHRHGRRLAVAVLEARHEALELRHNSFVDLAGRAVMFERRNIDFYKIAELDFEPAPVQRRTDCDRSVGDRRRTSGLDQLIGCQPLHGIREECVRAPVGVRTDR